MLNNALLLYILVIYFQAVNYDDTSKAPRHVSARGAA
jgi:hypothetical protein